MSSVTGDSVEMVWGGALKAHSPNCASWRHKAHRLLLSTYMAENNVLMPVLCKHRKKESAGMLHSTLKGTVSVAVGT